LPGWHEPTRGDLPELAGALGGVGISDKRERTRLAGTMARRALAPENRCDVIGEGDLASPLRKPEQAARAACEHERRHEQPPPRQANRPHNPFILLFSAWLAKPSSHAG